MHELSIVQALVKQCENEAKKHKASKVLNVAVKIGVLSGIEPHFLKVTYDTFKKGTICEEAELDMQIQNVIVRCNECNQTNELSENVFTCPNCDSINIDVLDGEDMILMRLDME